MLNLIRLLLALVLSVQIMASVHAAEHAFDHDHQETCSYSLHAYDPLSNGCEIANPVFQISYIVLAKPNNNDQYFSFQDNGLNNRGPPDSL